MPKYKEGMLKPPHFPELTVLQAAALAEIVKGKRVAEFGSGNSTLWMLQIGVKELWSVEHDKGWFDAVNKAEGDIWHSAEFRYFLVDSAKFPDPLDTKSLFDVVFVDCHDVHRNRVVSKMKERINPGGWMVLDDSHRPLFISSLNIMQKWEQHVVSGKKVHPVSGKVVTTTAHFWRNV